VDLSHSAAVEAGRSGCASLPGGDTVGDVRKLPVNTSLPAYDTGVRQAFAADWQLRFQVHFLFPE